MPELKIWERERNTAMKVFSRLFVGLKREAAGVPLGFATPYEENAAGRKRQDTVVRWAEGYGEYVNGKHIKKPAETSIMENNPREGFKITDDIKRVYWGGGNVVWRVLDPAGFELEIQSRNLMAIIQSCGINEGGEIPGRCIWGRSGPDNILLHESSDEYKDSVKAAELLKAPKQIGKTGRRVGGLYRRVNGTPAIFIGKVHVVKTTYAHHDDFEPASYTNLKEGKCIVSRSVYDLEPSEPFEAMLEIEDDGNGGVKLTSQLTLYKKAPCVDDLGDVEIPAVTDTWLMKLMWSFASSSISYRRIMSVTVNPILKPVAAIVPWSKERFDRMMTNVKAYIKNNSRSGSYPYRLPFSQILTHREEDVILFGDKLIGALATIGNQYGHRSNGEALYEIGLPASFSEGQLIWYAGTDHCSRIVSERGSYYHMSRLNGISDRSPVVEHLVIDEPKTVDEFYKFLDDLFAKGQFFYVTAKEAYV